MCLEQEEPTHALQAAGVQDGQVTVQPYRPPRAAESDAKLRSRLLYQARCVRTCGSLPRAAGSPGFSSACSPASLSTTASAGSRRWTSSSGETRWGEGVRGFELPSLTRGLRSTFCHKYLSGFNRAQLEELDIIFNDHDNEWDMFNWLSGKEARAAVQAV